MANEIELMEQYLNLVDAHNKLQTDFTEENKRLTNEISDVKKDTKKTISDERKVNESVLNSMKKQIEEVHKTMNIYIGNISPLSKNQVIILNQIKDLEKIQRVQEDQYARDNPIKKDDSVYHHTEETIESETTHTFTYKIPEGRVLYLRNFATTYHVDSTYKIYFDGDYNPTLSAVISEFGEHPQIFTPPKMLYKDFKIEITNSSKADMVYNFWVNGWLRLYSSEEKKV